MGSFRFDRLLEILAGIDLFLGILWLGLAVLSVTLLVLILTRWGQSHILRKCLMLSLLAHFLLAGYATTVGIMTSIPDAPGEPIIKVTLADGAYQGQAEKDMVKSDEQKKPWKAFLHDKVSQSESIDPKRVEARKTGTPRRKSNADEAVLLDEAMLERLALADAAKPDPKLRKQEVQRKTVANQSAEPIVAPKAQRNDKTKSVVPTQKMLQREAVAKTSEKTPSRTKNAGVPTALLQKSVSLPRMMATEATPEPDAALVGVADLLLEQSRGNLAEIAEHEPKFANNADVSAVGKLVKIGSPQLPMTKNDSGREVPEIYKMRTAPDRSKKARAHGANTGSEAAVKAALRWLAKNQERDGRWDAERGGAGKEAMVDGQSRQNAGLHADSGVTGLTLLAFLASGHTHLEGEYQENVRLGLSYLLLQQDDDGKLSGKATPFAAMYCHAMAAFALSEALAMTRDERLMEPVQRAIGYTIAAQDSNTGGWRYRPGDPGDTSQFGWQVMALKSAELAGIRIPDGTRLGMERFLKTVSSGRYGGLAAYRKGYEPTPPMTAEALVCRQFLGLSRDEMTSREAADFLLGQMPGEGKANFYYWYYATLAMHQLQGIHWQRWNEALQRNLVSLQQQSGSDAGSWASDTVWGSYGGRVYSTAMATLCLEVYYRFLPLMSKQPR